MFLTRLAAVAAGPNGVEQLCQALKCSFRNRNFTVGCRKAWSRQLNTAASVSGTAGISKDQCAWQGFQQVTQKDQELFGSFKAVFVNAVYRLSPPEELACTVDVLIYILQIKVGSLHHSCSFCLRFSCQLLASFASKSSCVGSQCGSVARWSNVGNGFYDLPMEPRSCG